MYRFPVTLEFRTSIMLRFAVVFTDYVLYHDFWKKGRDFWTTLYFRRNHDKIVILSRRPEGGAADRTGVLSHGAEGEWEEAPA